MNFIKCTQNGPILNWHIDRPERGNALGIELAKELAGLMADLNESTSKWLKEPSDEPPLRVLIISAEAMVTSKRRTWIAGGDLKELAKLDNPREYATTMSQILRDIERLPVPVIMKIDGAAIGGGAEFALAGDFRYVTTSSSMSFKQLQVGLATGYGSAKRIIDLVGTQKAKELLLLSQTLDAEECKALNIVTDVFGGPESMENGIKKATDHIISLDPQAVAAQKAMFHNAVLPPQMTQAAELKEFLSIWRNPTHEEFLNEF